MEKTFEAVYENGVVKPLQDLGLEDNQRVFVTITDSDSYLDNAASLFSPEEWERAKHDEITLEEVHRALSSILGSLSDAVIVGRGER